MSKKPFIGGVVFLSLLIVAGNASSQTEPVYAGWSVGEVWDGYGTVVRSTDSGMTWVRQGEGQFAHGKFNGVFAVNPLTAWIVGDSNNGYGTIYHTTDGGETWERKGSSESIPDIELAKVHASGDDIWVVATGTILHSSDGGETWANQMPAGYEEVGLQGVYAVDSNTAWATGGTRDTPFVDQHATLFKTTDGGETWSVFEVNEAGLNFILAISAVDADTAWGVGGPGYVLIKTTDGGENWTRQGYDNHQVGGIGDLNEVYAVDASTVWVAADSVIYRTTDGGENWSNSQGKISGSLAYMGMSAVSAQRAWASYAASDGYIASTTDGGETWAKVYPMGEDNNPGLWTVSFAIRPINPEPLTLTVGPGRHYQSIQSAVDAARKKDTIHVYRGFYEESVLVTTNNLKIVAVRDGVTVFSPTEGEAPITVRANRVVIRGFDELTGVPCTSGIIFEGSFNVFSKNVLNPGGCPGINALMCRDPDGGSNFNLISGNTIMHGDLGIVMTSTSPDVLNVGNIIRNNTLNNISSTGIVVQNGFGFRVYGNTIPGSVFGHCVSVIGDNNIDQGYHRITDNDITDCAGNGIALWADNRTRIFNNRISRNEISFSNHGINLYADPEAMVLGTLIKDNTVYHNQFGIVLEAGADQSLLFRNYVVTHPYDGIQVNGDWNRIYLNTAKGNGSYDLADWGNSNRWRWNDYETASWE